MSMADAIRGIFVPNIVPLDARGEIHEAELDRYTRWLVERGVHGLYPNGSTGEFLRFTPEERRRIVAIMAESSEGRVPILAGAAEANVRETIRACEFYHSLGARAVAIVSPFYYRVGAEGVYAYFAAIARESPIDITLYNIPMFASPIDVPTVRRLAIEFPRIIAIKDSSGDIAHMARMIEAVRPLRPDFAFLTGWDPALAPMLFSGCDGGTNATAGVVPEWTRNLFDAAHAQDREGTLKWQTAITRVFDAMMSGVDFPEGFRVGVRLRGFAMGAGRQPIGESLRRQLDELAHTLRPLLKEGLAAPPAGEVVDRVVRAVIRELHHRRA